MASADNYRVVISEQAAQMLVAHTAFLAQSSLAAAQRLITAFDKAARSLETLPQRGPWLRGDYIPKHTYRTLVFEKRYLLIYQLQENTVYVDYVVDCRQDYQWLIR